MACGTDSHRSKRSAAGPPSMPVTPFSGGLRTGSNSCRSKRRASRRLRDQSNSPWHCDGCFCFNRRQSGRRSSYRVVSAASGLQGKIPCFGSNDLVITSIVILGALFNIQPFGSSKDGFTFAPALAIWFFSLGWIGNNVC